MGAQVIAVCAVDVVRNDFSGPSRFYGFYLLVELLRYVPEFFPKIRAERM